MGWNFRKTLGAIARPLGGALGSLIPIPGVGTAVGTMVGGMVGDALNKEKKPKAQADPYAQASAETMATDKANEGVSRANYTTSRDRYRSAIDTMKGSQAANTEQWNPTNLQGTSSEVAQYQAQNLGTLMPGRLRELAPRNTAAVNTDQLKTFGSSNLAGLKAGTAGYTAPDLAEGAGAETKAILQQMQAKGGTGLGNATTADTSFLSSYDPQAAVNQYATGAWGLASLGLKDQLMDMRYDAAKRHRLNSGWFDEDQGRVVRDTSSALTGNIATKAVEAAGIKAVLLKSKAGLDVQQAENTNQFNLGAAKSATDWYDTLTRGASSVDELVSRGRTRTAELGLDALKSTDSFNLDRAGKMDANSLAAMEGATRLDLERGQSMDNYAKDVEFGAYDREAEKAKALDTLALDRAKGVDSFNLDRSTQLDKFGFDKAGTIDEFNWRRDAGVVDAEGNLLRSDQEQANTDADRYRDNLYSNMDRQQARDNARAQRRQSTLQNWLNIGKLGLDAYSTWKGSKSKSSSRPAGEQVYAGPTVG